MNRIFLVRHGENEANITREFSHRLVDYSLTPKGVLQAQQTAEHFRDKTIHAIYSSPLKRAVETAEIIAAPHGLPVLVLENFREVNVGDLERQPVSLENWKLYGEITTDWFEGRVDRSFPGGEDYVTLWERTRAGFQQVIAGRDGENIIVVGHGGLFTSILKDLCPDVDIMALLMVDNGNCSITEVLLDAHLRGQLVTWADCSHLHGDAANLIPGILRP